MMLSESQERMLMVLRPEKRAEAEAIFRKWGLDFAVVGHTTPDSALSRHATRARSRPICRSRSLATRRRNMTGRGSSRSGRRRSTSRMSARPTTSPRPSLTLMGSPDLCSRRWVCEQYDHVIGSNTAQLPGGDAAVVRIGDGNKAIALAVDVTPRYVEADPFEGSKQAVAECWRNLTAVGAMPLAVTDNLNFGNPERPAVMGQLVMSITGIGEACRALAFPVVSGNVSLYNETSRHLDPAHPDHWRRRPDRGSVAHGDARLQAGGRCDPADRPRMASISANRSICARSTVAKRARRRPSTWRRRSATAISSAARSASAVLSAVHDISDGGLVACLCEMALASGIGCRIDLPRTFGQAQLFGEDQARYVVTCRPEQVEAVIQAAKAAGVPASWIGSVTGSAVAILGLATVPLARLRGAHESWFPAFMAGEV